MVVLCSRFLASWTAENAQTTSYTPHMDYMDLDDRLPHDYDSAHKGGNRYSTILLYMTDQGEKDGGETVFTEAWPVGQPEEDHVEFETVRPVVWRGFNV